MCVPHVIDVWLTFQSYSETGSQFKTVDRTGLGNETHENRLCYVSSLLIGAEVAGGRRSLVSMMSYPAGAL